MKKQKISLQETLLILDVSKKIFSKLKKDFPKMKLGEEYNGSYKPFIEEYINTFMIDDIKSKNIKDYKEGLWQEIGFITCFCRWLDEHKNIKPKVKK